MNERNQDQQRSVKRCTYRTGFFGGKFLPFHRGHLDCILRCASECEKLYVVLMHNGTEEREILANYHDPFPVEHLSRETREMALRSELSPFDNIQVLAYDCREADEWALEQGKHPWFYECQDMVKLMGHFDVAYSSEPEYSECFRMFYPWADAKLVDPGRTRTPISASAIRRMPFYQAYQHLPLEYQKRVNKKVLFTGPESCGKSTLVRKLAAVLGTSFTEEMGKLACEKVKLPSPGAALYPGFVFAQKMADMRAVETANMVALCDTDAIVTEFYLELYENRTLPLVFETAKANSWDKVFFVESTVPWVADGIRTSPEQDIRKQQSEKLKTMYRELGYELTVLDGDYRENYEKALDEIRSLLGYEDGEE
ncbi:AAA family ATPase [Slackia heliotrinireducens]|uniref:AAA family ATPase n=1 Tax=Slackia heliotrinireducens TaxID=84110 RepID=UPI0033154CA2